MKFLKIFLIAGFLFATANAQIDTTQQHYWMMTYFINTEEAAGARLAFSSDSTGVNWAYYNNQAVILVPTVTGADGTTLMRDPMIQYDSMNNKFNFIWTVSWVGTTIGWDTSSNLTKWGTQVALPVGAGITGCYCCWAPEMFWDDLKGQWMILWSTAYSSTGDKHIYYTDVSGTDFTKFPTPQILFYPGFTIIDADMMKVAAGKYLMVFKDERNSTGSTQSKNVHYVVSSQPSGPFKGPKLEAGGSDSVMSLACVNATIQPSEGPTIIKQGGVYHLFFDPFNTFTSTYRMVEVGNIDTTGFPWPASPTLKAGTSNFDYNHSNVIEIPRRYVMHLLYNTPLPTPPATPTLLLPNDSASLITSSLITTPALSWSSVIGATGYNVQISTTSTFAAILFGQGVASSPATPSLAAGNTYYWRVNASTANAGAGQWSSVWSFSTTPSLVLPASIIARATDFAVSGGILAYSVIKAGAVEISLRDMLGRTALVIKRVNPVGKYSIDLKKCNLAAGQYIVQFKAAGMEKSAAVVLPR